MYVYLMYSYSVKFLLFQLVFGIAVLGSAVVGIAVVGTAVLGFNILDVG